MAINLKVLRYYKKQPRHLNIVASAERDLGRSWEGKLLYKSIGLFDILNYIQVLFNKNKIKLKSQR